MRGSDFLLPSGCLYFVLSKHVFYVFLYAVKSTRGFQNARPPSPSDRCSLFSSFPSSWHPSVSLFSLQSSSLLPCRHEMLLKTFQQRKQRKRKGRGNKVICSLPLSGNRRGETKVKNKRRDEIRRGKKRGKGVKEKRGSIVLQKKKAQLKSHPDSAKSYTLRHSKYGFFSPNCFFSNKESHKHHLHSATLH